MDRVSIKQKAKGMIKGNLWNFWKAFLVVMVVTFVITKIVGIVTEPNTILNSVLSAVGTALIAPLQVGVIAYVLQMVRGGSADLNILKNYFDNFLNLFLISLAVAILTAVGFVLLIVPGVIVVLMFAMVNYIAADNKDIDVKGALMASKEMMDGYKVDFLVFILSFLGWIIVGVLTLGIGLIWVIPYISYSGALYYEELKNKKNN